MTVLSSGMGLGHPAVTLQFLTNSSDPMALTQEEGSWFASINSIACPMGALLCGFILDKFGRKKTLIFINLCAIVSWSVMAAASRTNKDQMYIQLLVARFMIGIVTGLSSSPAAVYCAEISHPKLRGRLTLLTGLSISSGILLIYLLGYFIREDWRFISLICCGLTIFSLVILVILPESPSWLISKGKLKRGEKSLRRIRGVSKKDTDHHDLRREFDGLSDARTLRNLPENQDSEFFLKKKEVYKPLLVMIGFFAFQQFSGIFVIVVYGARVILDTGIEIDSLLLTVYIGIFRVIATGLVGILMDKMGRKPPSIISGVGMGFAMFGLAYCVFSPPEMTWLPIFFILTYIFTSTLGFLAIPFVMVAEVYPMRFRGVSAGITTCCSYLMSFMLIKSYPVMVEAFGNGNVFIFYGVVSFVGCFYIWYLVPETKGKTLQEIENYFKGTGKDVLMNNDKNFDKS